MQGLKTVQTNGVYIKLGGSTALHFSQWIDKITCRIYNIKACLWFIYGVKD